MNFFHLIFPCANIFFIYFPPPHPYKIPNGLSLQKVQVTICDVISAKRYGTALLHSIPPAHAANLKQKGFVITTHAAIYSVIQKGYQFPFRKDFSTEAVSTITEHTRL